MIIIDRKSKRILTHQFLTETPPGSGEILGIRRFPMGVIKTVLDLGAHVGMFSVLARLLHPGARVVSIEASPANIGVLTENTKNMLIEVHNVAVGSDSTVLLNTRGSMSGTVQEADTGSIKSYSLPSLLTHLKVDSNEGLFIKVDIEGSERNFVDDQEAENILRQCVGIDFEGHTTSQIPDAYNYVKWLKGFLSDTHDIFENGNWGRPGRVRGTAIIVIKKGVPQIIHPLSK